MTSNHKIISDTCRALGEGNLSAAKMIINTKYTFIPLQNVGRKYSEHHKMKIVLRDGYIDRYAGERMIFPPVLRFMSQLMPNEFPMK